jgi:trk system potassium uptake protein TrkH
MHLSIILRTTGILLLMFSATMLTPLPIAWIFGDGMYGTFLIAFAITATSGFLLFAFNSTRQDLRTREGFLITVLFYGALGTFGAVPFFLAQGISTSFTDALFESVSGLTTTGATVFLGLDEMPRSLLFYRQQLQWLGGMGIIVFAVAVLPMLGVGGMQLYRAESPGQRVRDNKLTPRITETAKALWLIYLLLTVACAAAFWLAGMSWFDAICHSFSTIAIGGFSTHDASIGFFDSPAIEAITVLFMLASAMNFGLHFVAFRSRSALPYWHDPEVRFFLGLMLALSFVVCAALFLSGTFDVLDGVRYGIFQTVSIATTTGFTTTTFSDWPGALPYLVFFAAFAGGCAGSTAGGLKIVRVLLIYLQGIREIKRLIHPSAVIPVKLGARPVPDRVMEAVWGFFSAYVIVFLLFLLLVLAGGENFITAFSAVGACLNNLGPGLGDVAQHYAALSDPSKWVLCLAMLMGRLEIFTLLVLFTPYFWQR